MILQKIMSIKKHVRIDHEILKTDFHSEVNQNKVDC